MINAEELPDEKNERIKWLERQLKRVQTELRRHRESEVMHYMISMTKEEAEEFISELSHIVSRSYISFNVSD